MLVKFDGIVKIWQALTPFWKTFLQLKQLFDAKKIDKFEDYCLSVFIKKKKKKKKNLR